MAYEVVLSGALAALIASGISYYGVRAANKSSLDRLKEQHRFDTEQAERRRTFEQAEKTRQLQFDEAQKNEDRKAAIRREVYLKAIEEATAVFGAIGGLPDKPFGEGNDGDALQDFLRANAKIWLVADSEATRLSRELQSLMSIAFFEGMQEAVTIRRKMEKVRLLQEMIGQAEREKVRIDTKLSEAKESNAPQQDQEAIGKSYKDQAEWAKAAQEAANNLMAEQKPDRKAWMEKMFDIIHKPQHTLNALLYELRKEVYLKTDHDNDREQFMQQYKGRFQR